MSTVDDYRGASAEAIQHHYDLSDDFYALWLDETRTYSCALFDDDPADTLERAQKRKLDHLLLGAKAPGAGHVLDIGCGWGSLMRRLVEHYDVGRVTGLTLSETQRDHVVGLGLPGAAVRLENWVEHEPEAPYDAIISIGAFEHFADFGQTREQRIECYRAFFERAATWLPLGGRLALQTNVKGNNVRLDRQMVRDLLFVIDEIFPQSEMPWTSEMIEASERIFSVVSFRHDPDHYARTCRHWSANLRARREEAEALVGTEKVESYLRYLESSIPAFERRHLGLVRVVFERTT